MPAHSAIDDIINANLECAGGCKTCAVNRTPTVCGFEPEHIRLMEDERSLARAMNGVGGAVHALAYYIACDELDAYRKEGGWL